jgi:hypothetical protein
MSGSCIFRKKTGDDPGEIELWEIEENLKRADLTTQERSDQTARWVELTELRLKVAQVGPLSPDKKEPGRGDTGGLRAAVRDLGIGRSEAQRAVQQRAQQCTSVHRDSISEYRNLCLIIRADKTI